MMSRKLIFLIISIVHGILMYSVYSLFAVETRIYVLLSLICYFIFVLYLLNRIYIGLKGIRPQIIFLFLYLAASYGLLHYFPALGSYAKAIYIVFAAGFSYLLMLGLNIYIVAAKRADNIPLLQPAKVVTYVGFVVVIFLGSTDIYKFGFFLGYPLMNLITKIICFAVFYFILFRNGYWLFTNERKETVMLVNSDKTGELGQFDEYEIRIVKRLSMFGAIALTEAAVILMFFPFEAFGVGVILGCLAYVINNTIQAYLSHKLNLRLLIESFISLFLVYLLVFFT